MNAIDESMYLALRSKPILKPYNFKYFGFTSEKPIEMLGQFVTEVLVGEVKLQERMVVVKGRHECLLSYQTAMLLEL